MTHAVEDRSPKQLTWEELCRDPNLRDLPYKIETNQRGQIVMSPVTSNHSFYQSEISYRLRGLLSEGKTAVEFAVRTPAGTKVADVAWLSQTRADQAKDTFDSPVAPEICIEVLSLTNAPEEIEEKRRLYFEAGAEEVWLCDEEGKIYFFDSSGARDASQRVPNFPPQVEI